MIGRHYSELIFEEDLEAARNLFNERRTGDRATRNVELRVRSRRTRNLDRSFQTQTVWMDLTAEGRYADPGERTRDTFIGTYGTARDISERKEAEQVINFQAYHDLLTHLPNRALLKDRLSLAITQAQRNKRRLAVMFLDLDRFKIVNDTLGHTMGDRLLKAVANRLQGCLRGGDTLSRFGGDEFTLLLPEVRTRDDVVVIASKILDKLSAPFVIDGHELFVGASIGIAMYPEAGDSVESLIQSSDIAMYHVKGRGKNGYQFFADEMNQKVLDAAVARARAAQRVGDGATARLLPTAGRSRGRSHHRRRSAGALATSPPRSDRTGRVPGGRRGSRTHHATRRMGAGARVRRGRASGARPVAATCDSR